MGGADTRVNAQSTRNNRRTRLREYAARPAHLEWLLDSIRPDDSRAREVIEILIERRHKNGRWPLNLLHPEFTPTSIKTVVGRASRWNTLCALRVLRWYTSRRGSRGRAFGRSQWPAGYGATPFTGKTRRSKLA